MTSTSMTFWKAFCFFFFTTGSSGKKTLFSPAWVLDRFLLISAKYGAPILPEQEWPLSLSLYIGHHAELKEERTHHSAYGAMPFFSHEISILVCFVIKHVTYPGSVPFWAVVEGWDWMLWAFYSKDSTAQQSQLPFFPVEASQHCPRCSSTNPLALACMRPPIDPRE